MVTSRTVGDAGMAYLAKMDSLRDGPPEILKLRSKFLTFIDKDPNEGREKD